MSQEIVETTQNSYSEEITRCEDMTRSEEITRNVEMTTCETTMSVVSEVTTATVQSSVEEEKETTKVNDIVTSESEVIDKTEQSIEETKGTSSNSVRAGDTVVKNIEEDTTSGAAKTDNSKVKEERKTQAPITSSHDQDIALYAHNAVRKLHGAPELIWDQNLAEEALKWAIKLAEKDSKLENDDPVSGYGENLYKAKGTSVAAKTYQAVMFWYKGLFKYNFKTTGYQDTTACFTQLVWDETTHVGVGVAYREDTRTTYIVARYSPPGNPRYTESYIEHVKPQAGGSSPRMPKLEDLIQSSTEDGNGLSNMGNLFEVLCHWCISDGDKPEEESKGCQPVQETSNEAAKLDVKQEQKTTSAKK